MSFNPASKLSLTGHGTFRGIDLHCRGDILDEPIREDLAFKLTATGRDQSLVQKLGRRVTFPVVGTFASLLPLYAFFMSQPFGRCLGPHMFKVESLNTGTDVLTISGHPFTSGDAVQVTWDETAPTLAAGSLSKTTTYYARSASASTVTLHPTALDATGNTNPVNFSADAVGDWFLCREIPLIVHRRSGVKRTYRNAVVEKLPDLVLSGGKLLFEGSLIFRCLPGLGTTPGAGDTAAFYAETNAAYTPPSWSGGDVLTQVVSAAWGGSAPWSAFRCEGGFRASFTPQLADFDDGVWPAATLDYSGFTVEVKGKPIGITVPEYEAAMHEDLGVLLDGEDLAFSASGFALVLKQAILKPAATVYSPNNATVQELTWMAGGQGADDLRAPFSIGDGA